MRGTLDDANTQGQPGPGRTLSDRLKRSFPWMKVLTGRRYALGAARFGRSRNPVMTSVCAGRAQHSPRRSTERKNDSPEPRNGTTMGRALATVGGSVRWLASFSCTLRSARPSNLWLLNAEIAQHLLQHFLRPGIDSLESA